MKLLKKAEEKFLAIRSDIFQATKQVENKVERTTLEIIHDLVRLIYDLLSSGCCCGCCPCCSDHEDGSNNNSGQGSTTGSGSALIPGGTNTGNTGTTGTTTNNGTAGNNSPVINPNSPILIPNYPKANNPDSDGKPVVVKPIQQNTISFDNGDGTTTLPGGAKAPTVKKPGTTSSTNNTTPDKKPVPALVVSNPDTSVSKTITKDDYEVEKPITPVNPSKSSS